MRDGLDLDNKSASEQLSIRNEAIEALLTLGYRNNEAKSQVDGVINNSNEIIESVEEILKEVFKNQINQK